MRLRSPLSTQSVAALAVAAGGISCGGAPIAPPSPQGSPPPAVASAPRADAATPRMALTHVTVVDVVNGTEQPDRSIIVDGDRIVAIVAGPPPSTPPTRVVELRGKYVIPGLWDMHVYLLDPAQTPLYVANGVTGVRVMWGEPFHQELRDAFDQQAEVGPRMIIGTPLLDGPKPIWPGSVALSTAEEGRAAVASAKRSGADFVSMYALLPRDVYFAIAAESKQQGLPFVGVVPAAVGVAEASDAGQKSIEHLPGMLVACSSREVELRRRLADFAKQEHPPAQRSKFFRTMVADAIASYDVAHASTLFAKFVANDTWQCPTLTVFRAVGSLEDPSLANDPRMPYVSARIKKTWSPHGYLETRHFSSEDYATFRMRFDQQLVLVREMDQAGVALLAGTSASNPYCFPGFGLHDELGLLVEAGLTPAAALRAATSGPARFLGQEAKMGTVAAGKVADLVVLDADPLADIASTRKIAAVVSRGTLYDRAALDQMLEAAKVAAARPEWGQGFAESPPVGSVVTGYITLVTSDRHNLDCASQAGVQGFRCGFTSEGHPRQIDEQQKLRPFTTLDQELYLIPGLFFEPTIDARYQAEPPTKPPAELQRFVVKCRIQVVGELADVKLRWEPDKEWDSLKGKKVSVATVSDCRISRRRW